ncbi:CinA family protein [Miniphocaeibacter halophilus]|uniref:CinA family protein n=1 Tax=Miniphocaeibacter halophilus TaxID=2931922 RepID=A0AC61N019_9FIRM|nr:CinA family protein [Miniphocaeibacter halophilus]QQK09030.1 CinA family protein [Miniphocaeibacter halophilus]
MIIEKSFCVEKNLKKILNMDYHNIEKSLVSILIKNNIRISTAESITGGLIASRIVNIAGASDIFEEGYVTYSDRIKNRVLGVKKETLNKYTAVSEEVCYEMLINLKNITKADSIIVTTGYAGPGENAGLAFVGINLFNFFIIKKINVRGNRNEIRKKIANIALNELYIRCRNQHNI